MGVWTQRIVFGAEIKSFGLSEREVREVLNRVLEGDRDWEVDDIRNGSNGNLEIFLEFNEGCRYYFGGKVFENIKRRAEELFELIEEELKRYAAIKPYLETYFNCNGHNGRKSEAKEIMKKVGIPVIS